MREVICIPTLDRPNELSRLLTELMAQKIEFGNTLPIYVFDHSPTDSAREVAQSFTPGLCIYHIGSQDRVRFIDDVVDSLNLSRQDVTTTFSRGFGGNRNFMLAMTIKDTALYIDDDCVPVSFKDPTLPAPKEAWVKEYQGWGDLILELGYQRPISPAKGVIKRFDWVDAMLSSFSRQLPFGFFVKQERHPIDRKDGKRVILTNRDAYDDHKPSGRKEAVFGFPHISFNGDMMSYATPAGIQIAGVIFKTPIIESPASNLEDTDRKPNVCAYSERMNACTTRSHSDGLGCYAAKNPSISVIPFVPTCFRYEDLLYNDMHDYGETGESVFIEHDVMHAQGPRQDRSPKEFVHEDICGMTLQSILLDYLHEGCTRRDLNKKEIWADISGYLSSVFKRGQTFGGNTLRYEVEKKFNSLKECVSFDLDKTRLGDLTKMTQEELKNAAATFSIWPKIREYLLNKKSAI